MGDVRIGDVLYDAQGEPCRVTYATAVQFNRPCYEVEFDDGTVIVADADHQWFTWDKAARKSAGRRLSVPSRRHGRAQCAPRCFPAVVTTAEIDATLRVANGREVNHSIETCLPIRGEACPLPIDPYVLGVWLGDGDSKAAVVTSADPEILAEVASAGCAVGAPRRDPRSQAVRYAIGRAEATRDFSTGRMESTAGTARSRGVDSMVRGGSLHATLRESGLLQNKHIPPAYLRAPVPQRLALLQGLMDTDGSITPGGHCEFCTTSPRLARDVNELARSLGVKTTIAESDAVLYGVVTGRRWRIKFTPNLPVFRLARKRSRQRHGTRQANRTRHRYIVAVRPCSSVPVRCLQVDSASHLFLASRAFIPTHNTRAGLEWVRERVKSTPLVNLIAPTVADLRDVLVDGPSGLLTICGSDRPQYEPSKRRLSWPNGARSLLFSADEPERLRGPQHMSLYCDEIAAWRYPEAFTQAMFGLRLGPRPQCVVTTTPKPSPLILELVARPSTVTTTGSSYENAANLSPEFFRTVIAPYEGTRLGEQEIHGRILTDNPAALWKHEHLRRVAAAPDCVRVVVGVDPGGLGDDAAAADATGIIVAGLGTDGYAYVLADRTVVGLANTPDTWAEVVVNTYDDFQAGRIVAEVNQGGRLVEAMLRTKHRAAAYKPVHAATGKYARAEPVAALYEQGRVFHVGRFPELEQELLTWTPNSGRPSPNRLDALVYALTELMVVPGKRKLHAY